MRRRAPGSAGRSERALKSFSRHTFWPSRLTLCMNLRSPNISRRSFCRTAAAATLAMSGARTLAGKQAWQPRYVVASCMYGEAPLAEILPEIAKTTAQYVDLWPRPHGNQREQLDELGVGKFNEM